MTASAAEIIDILRSRNLTIATAESLTGGLVIASLIDVPGASTIVRGGAVAYMADVKSSLFDVSADLIDEFGTVHPQVALALACGAVRVFGADIGVGTTGVAGPGAHEDKPAGTVHVAAVWGVDDPTPAIDSPVLVGDRTTIRLGAVRAALSVVRARLEA